MPSLPIDPAMLAIVLLGAGVAGFITGFAGFGTALVASGLWFHALPAEAVPPLAALATVAAQLIGRVADRRTFDWHRARPFLIGGALGVPFGVGALAIASPFALRTSVGAFLIAYASYHLVVRVKREIGAWGGRRADGIVGFGGGFLGGFAGLSGPLPLIWLQLRGGPSAGQRATYQPFNLIILALASLVMAISGQITTTVLWAALLCLPVTLVSAWIGARAYVGVSAATFQRIVLTLLLLSGLILIGQSLTAK